jgi:hypothetical protein
MQSGNAASADSWFRSPAGRRYGRHFAWLIAAKIVLLSLLYFVFIAPQSRVDTSPAAMRARLDTSAIQAGEQALAPDAGPHPETNPP